MSHSAPRAIAAFFTPAPPPPRVAQASKLAAFHVATVLALPAFRPIPPGPSERLFPSSFPRFLPPPRLETSHQLKYGSLELPSLPHSALRRCLATALAWRLAWETEAWTERTGRGSFRRRAGVDPTTSPRWPEEVSFSQWVWAFPQFGVALAGAAHRGRTLPLHSSGTKRVSFFSSAGTDVHL